MKTDRTIEVTQSIEITDQTNYLNQSWKQNELKQICASKYRLNLNRKIVSEPQSTKAADTKPKVKINLFEENK